MCSLKEYLVSVPNSVLWWHRSVGTHEIVINLRDGGGRFIDISHNERIRVAGLLDGTIYVGFYGTERVSAT